MRRLLRILLLKPVLWASAKFSSQPDRTRVFKSLSKLLHAIRHKPGKKGMVIPFELQSGKFIIFSDQHKGRRNGADDFAGAEPNYLAALRHYNEEGFYFINLGDSEELWENNIWQVKRKNKATFEAEKKFLDDNRYIKIFGNHDLYWDNSLFASFHLRGMYGVKIKVYEGVILECPAAQKKGFTGASHSSLTIFLTHGHQGDAQSDGNWFSKFFVGWIWAPLQALLRVNPNTPAYNTEKKTLHNRIMYEWASGQKNLLLVTGHTHQPVFASLTHLERLYRNYRLAEKQRDTMRISELKKEIGEKEKDFTVAPAEYDQLSPCYFNSGCCCFSDGDITGIEISEGCIRLIKWGIRDGKPRRKILEESPIGDL